MSNAASNAAAFYRDKSYPDCVSRLRLLACAASIGMGCGHEDVVSRTCPIRSGDLHPVAFASSGLEKVTLALMNDGSAWCWGDNKGGACPTIHSLIATPRRTNVSCAVQVSAFDNGGAALLGGGAIAIWSAGANGQHGDPGGGIHDPTIPEVLTGVPPMTRIVSAARSEFAITTTGELWWWGVFDNMSNAQLSPVHFPDCQL